MKKKITVNDIGHGLATKEEINKRLKIRTIQKELGLLPRGYDQTDNNDDTNDKIPFSKIYRTEQDFRLDQSLASKYLVDGIEIPSDLYKRIKETMIELEKKYGDKYKYLY